MAVLPTIPGPITTEDLLAAAAGRDSLYLEGGRDFSNIDDATYSLICFGMVAVDRFFFSFIQLFLSPSSFRPVALRFSRLV
jgi:hypothetical protein